MIERPGLFLWPLLLVAGAASAEDRQVGAPPAECTRATAVPATIQVIMNDQKGWSGRCVKVRAISNGLLLFPSVEGYYLAGPLMGGDPNADPDERERLGLDNRRLLRRHPRDGLRMVTAVGRVQDCETIRDSVRASDGPGEFSMVLGFCHMANGPYLWLKHFDIGRLLYSRRLVGEAMRAKVGDLTPPPGNWPHWAFVEDYARRYLDALRRSDRAAFRELHGGEEVNTDSAVRLAFGDHKGFRRLRRADAEPQMAIFFEGRPDDLPKASEDSEYEGYGTTICFCLQGDCTSLWPIARIDADNREDRPFVCTRFGPYVVHRKGTFPFFYTERDRHGLPEPRSLH